MALSLLGSDGALTSIDSANFDAEEGELICSLDDGSHISIKYPLPIADDISYDSYVICVLAGEEYSENDIFDLRMDALGYLEKPGRRRAPEA